jgi:hypothetical protein
VHGPDGVGRRLDLGAARDVRAVAADTSSAAAVASRIVRPIPLRLAEAAASGAVTTYDDIR